MKFAMSQEAQLYFQRMNKKKSLGSFETTLEFYWLCAVIGILENQPIEKPDNLEELVDHFTKRLQLNADSIRALLFYSYYSRHHSEFNEERIMTMLGNFLDFDERTRLTAKGMTELNERAEAGFRTIKERFPEPTDVPTFLVDYIDLLDEIIKEYGAENDE